MTLQRQDIITDDALMAPAVLSKEFEKLLTTINTTKEGIKKANAELSGAKSTGGIAKGIKEITDAEKEVIKIQGQLSSALAKSNDEYVEYKRLVNDVNKAVADKVKWGGLDATQVNAQNSSITRLNLALQKNRQAYANLKTEQDRSSKSGQVLLKTIQQQDADIKKLNGSMGKFTDNVGNYGSAMQGLDGVTGGVVGRFQQLGKAFLALLANPIVLLLATLVGGFVALKDSVETFFTSTAEGEERLSRQKATWDAFFITLKQGWADVGKSVMDFFGDDGLKGLFDTFLLMYFPSLWAQFQVTEDRSQKLNAALRKLTEDHAKDVVEDAQTELDVNKLLEVSRNKLKFTAEERIAALKKANDLRRDQAEGDLQLAKDDLAAFDMKIKLERKGGKMLLADMTERAKLQAAVTKVESDAAAGRTSRLKLEKALTDEIHNDNIKALQDTADKELAIEQQLVEDKIQLVRDAYVRGEITRKAAEEKILFIQKANAAALIEAQIKGLETIMASTETNAEEDAAIAIKIAKLKIDLNKAVFDSITELDEVTIKQAETVAEKLQRIYGGFLDGLGKMFTDNSDANIASIDAQIAALEEKTQRDIELAGDNEAWKRQIEDSAEARREQLEEKKRKEQIKQARFDKANAIITSAINTSIAYTAALAVPPAPNIPRAILAGILGGIQTAAIAAKPIPQFFTGVDSSPAGPAWVGEKGAELKITPSGQVSLTPSTPTLDYLQRGTRIVPHDETMRMLALSSLGNDVMLQREQNTQVELARSLKAIEKNTRKLGKSMSSNLYKEGILTYEQKIKEDGSKQRIRRSMLGR